MENPDPNLLKIKIEDRKNTFILEARPNNMAMLKAPVEGSMDRRIPESIDASLKITKINRKGRLVFTDSTNITGLEMVGDLETLIGVLK